ncbi:MAG: hypothetical protein DBX47_00585 [Clostridiales bacterium]|nr:MAG: hypothetical protein DBX47_00585 [Clostridiales bacterium]
MKKRTLALLLTFIMIFSLSALSFSAIAPVVIWVTSTIGPVGSEITTYVDIASLDIPISEIDIKLKYDNTALKLSSNTFEIEKNIALDKSMFKLDTDYMNTSNTVRFTWKATTLEDNLKTDTKLLEIKFKVINEIKDFPNISLEYLFKDENATVVQYNVYQAKRTCGDIDNNGIFNSQDCALAFSHVAGNIILTKEAAARGDFNEDGALDLGDSLFLTSASLGKLLTPPMMCPEYTPYEGTTSIINAQSQIKSPGEVMYTDIHINTQIDYPYFIFAEVYYDIDKYEPIQSVDSYANPVKWGKGIENNTLEACNYKKGIIRIACYTYSTSFLVSLPLRVKQNITPEDSGLSLTLSAMFDKQANPITLNKNAEIKVKNTQQAPAAPKILYTTDNAITVEPVQGCEYRIKDGEWHKSNVFERQTGAYNDVYIRYAETETAFASEPSASTTFINTIKGDVNNFNCIELSDAMNVFQYIAGKRNLDLTGKLAADMNNDGKISLIDAMNIFRYISGKVN